MERINETVCWYQHKIGTYDKQLWERSVEKKVLKSIHNVPKKTVKDKPELIDVDLVRGSTFPKAKPRHGWLSVTRQGIVRTILLPLYFKWWYQQTNAWFTILLVVFYSLQMTTLCLYCKDPGDRLSAESISAAHVVTPIIMMILLGLLHSHIIATQEANRPRRKPKVSKSTNKKSRTKDKAHVRVTDKDQSYCKDKSHDTNKTSKRSEEVTGLRQRKFSSKTLLNRRRSSSLVNNGNVLANRRELDRSGEADDETDDEVTCSKVKVAESKVTQSKVMTGVQQINCAESAESLSTDAPVSDLTSTQSQCEIVSFPNDRASFHNDLTSKLPDKCGAQKSSNPVEDSVDNGNSTNNQSDLLTDELAPFSLDTGQLCDGFMEVTGEFLPSVESVGNLQSAMEETDPYSINPKERCHNDDVDCISNCEIDKDSGVHTRNETDSNSETSQHLLEGAAYEKLGDPSLVKPWGHIIQDIDDTELLTCDINDATEFAQNAKGSSVLNLDQVSGGGGGTTSVPQKPSLLNLRRNPVKIGVSSCESETEAATPLTPKIGSELEWEDHSDMTSCADTSSNTASDSQLTDDLSEDSSDREKIPHIASVMNNLASGSDKVSCMIWEDEEVKKIDLTVLDIGWTIIRKVDKIPETCDYLVVGLVFSLLVSTIPGIFRLYWSMDKLEPADSLITRGEQIQHAHKLMFGHHWSESMVVINGMLQRFLLGVILFFLLSVAERTFKQRLLYAKHFCYLTSSRRAKKYDMPHFRLNKVRNIRTWFSLRSYLKKRGPQRSVDTIVSVAFVLEVVLISVMCFQLLQDSESFLEHLGNWELIIWCMALSIYLLRFMTLGTKINKKYRNFSVLITEQINLYLQMEQKPHKKDELMMANSVLKLAEALLKELEIPFKISGLSANPFLYNITKVILLSAFSAVLTELLGFKLKLYKIKLRA